MTLRLEQLAELPSPFYRVAVKALILDDQQRLLVVLNEHGLAELPGGGWEHDESLEEGLRREVSEEAGASIGNVSDVVGVFSSKSSHGWRVMRILVRATLTGTDPIPGDEMTGVQFVTQDEFLALQFDVTDAPIQQLTNIIWSN